ncbi:MAG: hypothetical protein JJ910_11420 [Maricaulis sp.]|nr:hypothetical protein [Maricaulis sp.]
MYLRFCSFEPYQDVPGACRGFFDIAYEVRNNPATPDWLYEAVRDDIRWFCDTLPAPKRVDVRSRGRWLPLGFCWFRSQAREHVSRARGLASLVELAGHPIRMIRHADPGEIIYSDEFQIVAKRRKGRVSAAL